MVQRRVARFVTNNHDRTAIVTQMVHSLQWDTLEARRNNLRAVLQFYCIKLLTRWWTYNNQKDYLCLQTALITRGHSLRYLQPRQKLTHTNTHFSHNHQDMEHLTTTYAATLETLS